MALAAGTQRISTRATGVVGVAILCSRVLGLIREVVFAALFGASRNMDAFLTAFRAPNMLRDLFAEGALSTAFVTTFSRRIATDGDASAWRLASKVATLTLAVRPAEARAATVVLYDGANSYENATTVPGLFGTPPALNGAFTLWVRRPIVRSATAGQFADDDDGGLNDTMIITAEGIAPYTGAAGSTFSRNNLARRIIDGA